MALLKQTEIGDEPTSIASSAMKGAPPPAAELASTADAVAGPIPWRPAMWPIAVATLGRAANPSFEG